MKNLIFLTFFVFVVTGSSCQTTNKKIKGEAIVFYNVENLFDTINEPNKNDDEYIPDAAFNWDSKKYNKKISDLAKVISSVNKTKLPIIVGLAEVENNLVLNDLIKDIQLKKANYNIIWKESPDERGIDCAFLYQPSVLKIETSEFLSVYNKDDETFKSRDIIYVKGIMNKEIFHFFINHWPSRRGGKDETDLRRSIAANVLRNKVDLILGNDKNANIVILGDFNDEPSDESILKLLGASSNKDLQENSSLINLMYDEYERGEGSYQNRGDWNMLDNIIISRNLIYKEKGLKTSHDNGYIFHLPFMEYVNDKGEMSPNRTYGKNYYGGISDHFPVYMIIK